MAGAVHARGRRGLNRRASPAAICTALTLAVVSWGLSNVAARYLLARLGPLEVVALRYTIASGLFVPVFWQLRRTRWSWPDLGAMGLFGVFGVAGFNLPVTLGTRWLPAGTVGLLVATEPIWISVISVAVLRERLAWPLPAGLALAAAGAALLIGGHGPSVALLGGVRPEGLVEGAGLVLLGACSWAVFAVGVRPYSQRYGAVTSTGVAVTLGSLPLLLSWNTALVGRVVHLALADWTALVFLGGVCTMLATILWNYAAARTSAAQAGPWIYLVPLASVLGGHVFLGEPIAGATLAGGAIIILGIAISQIHPCQFWRKSNADK